MKTFTVRETASKGILFEYDRELPSAIFGIPVGQSILHQLEKVERPRVASLLHFVDVAENDGERRVVLEQRKNDRRALVLVQTMPGAHGAVGLFSNTLREYMGKDHRVKRELMPLSEAVGVTLVADLLADEDHGPEFLVAMEPGASFRIVRTGNLRTGQKGRGAPPELVVMWNGRWEHGVEEDPEKRQNMKNWSLRVYDRFERHGHL